MPNMSALMEDCELLLAPSQKLKQHPHDDTVILNVF